MLKGWLSFITVVLVANWYLKTTSLPKHGNDPSRLAPGIFIARLLPHSKRKKGAKNTETSNTKTYSIPPEQNYWITRKEIVLPEPSLNTGTKLLIPTWTILYINKKKRSNETGPNDRKRRKSCPLPTRKFFLELLRFKYLIRGLRWK